MKYVFITGRTDKLVNNKTVSGLVGMTLQASGNSITYASIEKHLNVGIGNMDLRDTGEVFVLADGSEVPLGFGVFERCCGVALTAEHYITMGKIIEECVADLKKRTDNVPAMTIEDAVLEYIKHHLETGFSEKNPSIDYLILDLGCVFSSSDCSSKLISSAIDRFINNLSPADFIILNVEDKTGSFYESAESYRFADNFIKNTNISAKETTILSLLISENDSTCHLLYHPLNSSKKTVDLDACAKRTASSFGVLQLLAEVPFFEVGNNLEISSKSSILACDALINIKGDEAEPVKIGVLGELGPDCRPYHSIEVALKWAGAEKGKAVDVVYILVEEYAQRIDRIGEAFGGISGILIPGGFGSQYLETKLEFVKYARLHNLPLLGICLGYQLSIIEFARNVLNIKDATSEEFDCSSKFPVVRKAPSIVCSNTGRDIFLGDYLVEYRGFAQEVYSLSVGTQRFRHRYMLNNLYAKRLEKFGMSMVGKSTNDRIVAFKLQNHRFFVGVQYHPELNTSYSGVDPIISAFVTEALTSNMSKQDN